MADFEAGSKTDFWEVVCDDDFYSDCACLENFDCPPPVFDIPAPPPPPGNLAHCDQNFRVASSSSSLDNPTRLHHFSGEDAVTTHGKDIFNTRGGLSLVENSCDALLIKPFDENLHESTNLNLVVIVLGSLLVVFLALGMAGIFFRWKKNKRRRARKGISETAVQETSNSFGLTSSLDNAGSFSAEDNSHGKLQQPTPGESPIWVALNDPFSCDKASHKVPVPGECTLLYHQIPLGSGSLRGLRMRNSASSAAYGNHPVEINGRPFFLVPANGNASKTLHPNHKDKSHLEWLPPNFDDIEYLGHQYEDIDQNVASGSLKMGYCPGATYQTDPEMKRGAAPQGCFPNSFKNADSVSYDNPFFERMGPLGGPSHDILPAESDFIVMVNRQASLQRPVAHEGFSRRLVDSDSGISVMDTPSPQRPSARSFQCLATIKQNPGVISIGSDEEHLDCQASIRRPTYNPAGAYLHPAFTQPCLTAVSSEYSIPVDSPSSPVSLSSYGPCLEVPSNVGGGDGRAITTLLPVSLPGQPLAAFSFYQERSPCHPNAAHLPVYLQPSGRKSFTKMPNSRWKPRKTAQM